jgi:hypothetical protein
VLEVDKLDAFEQLLCVFDGCVVCCSGVADTLQELRLAIDRIVYSRVEEQDGPLVPPGNVLLQK